MKYLYKKGDRIINVDGDTGIIEDLGTSQVDNNTFASYWVIYDTLHKDMKSRNLWQSSIIKRIKK